MSSRKEQKEALRRERLEREQAAAVSQRRRKRLGYAVGGLLSAAAVGTIAWLLLAGGGGGGEAKGGSGDFPSGSVPAQRMTQLDEAARAAGCRVVEAKSEGQEHVTEPVAYKSNPPHSGNHFVDPAEDGAYLESPPTERLVHSLEHGRIVVQFAPNSPDAVKGNLKALYDEDPYHLILVPNGTEMPFQVAATAWTKVLGCPTMNDRVFDAIRTFKDRFRDRGPEFVP